MLVQAAATDKGTQSEGAFLLKQVPAAEGQVPTPITSELLCLTLSLPPCHGLVYKLGLMLWRSQLYTNAPAHTRTHTHSVVYTDSPYGTLVFLSRIQALS